MPPPRSWADVDPGGPPRKPRDLYTVLAAPLRRLNVLARKIFGCHRNPLPSLLSVEVCLQPLSKPTAVSILIHSVDDFSLANTNPFSQTIIGSEVFIEEQAEAGSLKLLKFHEAIVDISAAPRRDLAMSTIMIAVVLVLKRTYHGRQLVDKVPSHRPHIRRVIGLYPFSAEPPLPFPEYIFRPTTAYNHNRIYHNTHDLTSRAHPTPSTPSLAGSLLFCLRQVVKATILLVELIFNPTPAAPTNGVVFKDHNKHLKHKIRDNKPQQPITMDAESDTHTAFMAYFSGHDYLLYNYDDSAVSPEQSTYDAPFGLFPDSPDYSPPNHNSESMQLLDHELPGTSVDSLDYPPFDCNSPSLQLFDNILLETSIENFSFNSNSLTTCMPSLDHVPLETSADSPGHLPLNSSPATANFMQFDYVSPEASVNSADCPPITDDHPMVDIRSFSHIPEDWNDVALYSGVNVSDGPVYDGNIIGINTPQLSSIASYEDGIFGCTTDSFEELALASNNTGKSPLSEVSSSPQSDYLIAITPSPQTEGLPTPMLTPDNNSASSPSSPMQLGFAPASYMCKCCHNVYPRRCDLTKHFKTHLKDLQCEQCPKRFSARRDLRRHVDGVHLHKKDYWCELCAQQGVKKEFSRKDNFKAHKRKVHKV